MEGKPEKPVHEPEEPEVPPHIAELASSAINEVMGEQPKVDTSIGEIAKTAFKGTNSSEDFTNLMKAINNDPRTRYLGKGKYILKAKKEPPARNRKPAASSDTPRSLSRGELEKEIKRINSDPDIRRAMRQRKRPTNRPRSGKKAGHGGKKGAQGRSHGKKVSQDDLFPGN